MKLISILSTLKFKIRYNIKKIHIHGTKNRISRFNTNIQKKRQLNFQKLRQIKEALEVKIECGVCMDSYPQSEIKYICTCQARCTECFEHEKTSIINNRGVSHEMERMLKCQVECKEKIDVKLFNLSPEVEKQIRNTLGVQVCASEQSHANTEENKDDIILPDDVRLCPKCKAPISRSDGCRHMTHKSCPSNDYKDVHYCDWCSMEVFKETPNTVTNFYDSNGDFHFPDGVYEKCIVISTIDENEDNYEEDEEYDEEYDEEDDDDEDDEDYNHILCFSCNNRGHIARNCVNNRYRFQICYNCNRRGHIARHCRN